MTTLSPKRFDFEPGVLPREAFDYQHLMSMGATKAAAKRIVQEQKRTAIWMSDTYQVNVLDVPCAWGFAMTWLSIKRRDKEAFHDWRELQQIKNAIVGPDREAVEIYPAEARMVDTANQYHLWALPAGKTFPFGFNERMVIGDSTHNAKQRPFEKPGEPE